MAREAGRIPGKPGRLEPDPVGTSPFVRAESPLVDTVVTGLGDAAVQLAGTDIEPIEPARPTATVVLPGPAAPPTPVATLCSAAGGGVTSAAVAATGIMPILFWAPMMSRGKDSTFARLSVEAKKATAPSRKVESLAVTGSDDSSAVAEVACDKGFDALELLTACATEACWALTPSWLVFCRADENGVNCVASAELAA